MIINKNPIMKDIDGKNITILQLNASAVSRITDKETGIVMGTLQKNTSAYPPMHPTPAS